MILRTKVPALALLTLSLCQFASSQTTHTAASANDITYSEAKPVLDDFAGELPDGLESQSTTELQRRWPKYVRLQDLATRERLLQGDEDSLVNLLLYGASFTAQPRLTSEFLAKNSGTPAGRSKDDLVAQVLQHRIADLITAMQAKDANERLQYMRSLLEHKGQHFDSPAARETTAAYLLVAVNRVHAEFGEFNRQLAQARATGNANLEFAVRSTLYKQRGISLDTSIMPDYALEESLKELLKDKLIQKGGIHRVAIIGPGLDFTDKAEGFDFYPQQTNQPFLLLDSLLRLGLSSIDNIKITTLDISPRVNQHIEAIRRRAEQGQPYTLQLPLRSDRNWTSGARAFWQNAGSFVAKPVKPVAVPPAEGKLEIRAVRISPATVLRIYPEDENVVWQRLPLPEDQRYDLVVATNILVYYDEFHQALALANVQAMLKKGGLLLTNDGLPEVQTLSMPQIGRSSTSYSDQQLDGDHIIWYQYKSR